MSAGERTSGASIKTFAKSGIYGDRAKSLRARVPEPFPQRLRVALCFLIALGVMLGTGRAQNPRVVQGKAIGSNDQPLQNAIVYLEDQKSLEIKTYITEADGKFRFGQLSSDVDYHAWAKYEGHKSKTKSISSFDSKKLFDFDLKVDTGK